MHCNGNVSEPLSLPFACDCVCDCVGCCCCDGDVFGSITMVVEFGDVELVLQSVIDFVGDVDGSSNDGLRAIGSGLMAGIKLADDVGRLAIDPSLPNCVSVVSSIFPSVSYSFDCVIEHRARLRDV